MRGKKTARIVITGISMSVTNTKLSTKIVVGIAILIFIMMGLNSVIQSFPISEDEIMSAGLGLLMIAAGFGIITSAPEKR